MQETILYLLGAGASCNALPLVKTFNAKLAEFADKVERYVLNKESHPVRQDFVNDIRWLAREVSHHASVDTFAKKLFFLGDNKNLKRLKAILSTFLAVEQALNHVDLRYDSFLASVLDFDHWNNLSFPDNLRMVTWNYDSQLEKALYGFCEKDKLVTDYLSFNPNRFYRMNGCCGTPSPGSVLPIWFRSYEPDDLTPLLQGLSLYKAYMAESNWPDISFAWERSERLGTELKMREFENVTTLIVIGYSFPYFNRKADQLLFKQIGNLQRVYLQCGDEDYSSVQAQLKKLIAPAIADGGVERIPYLDRFYIPDEL